MTTTTSGTAGTAGPPTAPPADPAATRGALVPLLFGFFPTQVLHVAATLRIVDHLEDGPRSVDDLAAATGTDAPSLARLLRALACFGVLDEVDPGTYGPGLHAAGLRSDGPSSIRNLVLLFAGPEVWGSWGDLDDAVRTGAPPFDRIAGAPSFEHMRQNPELQAVFNQAMSEGTRNAVPGIAEVGGFERFRSVVDVGGGDGTLLAGVLAAHRHLAGTVFDLAEGLDSAADTFAAAGVADRAATESGDFFAAVPAGADAYLVKSVIHDWDDERAGAILRRIREAIGADGTLLVVEPVMPDAPAGSTDVLMMVMSDLNMLVCTGGKERTEAEFRALLTASGFTLTAITPVTGPTNFSVIEAAPTPAD